MTTTKIQFTAKPATTIKKKTTKTTTTAAAAAAATSINDYVCQCQHNKHFFKKYQHLYHKNVNTSSSSADKTQSSFITDDTQLVQIFHISENTNLHEYTRKTLQENCDIFITENTENASKSNRKYNNKCINSTNLIEFDCHKSCKQLQSGSKIFPMLGHIFLYFCCSNRCFSMPVKTLQTILLIVQILAVTMIACCSGFSDPLQLPYFNNTTLTQTTITTLTTTRATGEVDSQPNFQNLKNVATSSKLEGISIAFSRNFENIHNITKAIDTQQQYQKQQQGPQQQQQRPQPQPLSKTLTNGNQAKSSVVPPPNRSIINLINRDNILGYHNSNSNTQHALNTASSTSSLLSSTATAPTSTCRSCQMREKAKLDSLESIKLHILMRLQLSQLPNITLPIQVPHIILEKFYKNSSATRSFAERGRTKAKSSSHATTKANSQKHRQQDLYVESDSGHGVNVNIDSLDADDGPNSSKMQSDDPHVYQQTRSMTYNEHSFEDDASVAELEEEEDDDFNLSNNLNSYDEEHYDDEFFSRVNSVYVFPTVPRMRHNRKTEILNFKFDNNYSTILRTIIHIYIRGFDWIREHEPMLLELYNSTIAKKRTELVISVHRAVQRPNTENFTHTIKLIESHHKIPPGLGKWIQIKVNPLSTHWMEKRNSTQSVVIRGLEPWMRPLIVTGDSTHNKPLSVHIEVLTQEKHRRKRSTSLDCQESDNEVRCCRYPLKVNFTNFGWHFVVAPTSFDAFFCNGECKVGYLEQYTHTHIASLTTSATPCCSPTKMSPLSLLYFNLDQNLVLSTIPNMSVEKCSCS